MNREIFLIVAETVLLDAYCYIHGLRYMISLGIECTAHTFAVGIVEKNNNMKILADARDVYKPSKELSGIHPTEAMQHHDFVKESVLERALSEASLSLNDVDIISYSAGPGLPPCLKIGTEFVKALVEKTKKPVFAVNHPVAHIEIGKVLSSSKDPIILYVSGGNTQIIGYENSRYRVFGETQDIPIGNAIDTLMRNAGVKGTLGGAELEKRAEKGKKYIELPYVVKGMDLSFSGLLTAATQKFKKNPDDLENICFSFQETCYAMLAEVCERALAHTGKKELLVTGGVAASRRLNAMLDIMCSERGAKLFSCPGKYTGDNGVMIAYTGALASQNEKPLRCIDFYPRWRVDDAQITWMEQFLLKFPGA